MRKVDIKFISLFIFLWFSIQGYAQVVETRDECCFIDEANDTGYAADQLKKVGIREMELILDNATDTISFWFSRKNSLFTVYVGADSKGRELKRPFFTITVR